MTSADRNRDRPHAGQTSTQDAKHALSGPGLALLAAMFLIGAVLGCEKSEPTATTAPAGAAGAQAARASKPSGADQDPEPLLPELPGQENEQAAGMEIMVKRPRVDGGDQQDGYVQDDNCPSGRLVGACKFVPPVTGHPRASAEPLELTGAYAIPDPEPGEVEYYKNLKLTHRQYFSTYRGIHPVGVVLMLRDVRKGGRQPLSRATFLIRQGRFRPHVQVGPLHERVMFGTYDSYPTDVVMKSLQTGQVVLDGRVSAFDRDTIKPLGRGGLHYTARPKMQQSPVIHAPGGYQIQCKRHAWKRAYVYVVDNPYATISDRERFTIDNVPVGKWILDAWHPEYKPVKTSYEIEIRKDETTELAVEFHTPEFLLPKPKEAPDR